MFIFIVIWNDCSIQDLLLIMAIWFSLCLANCISHFLQIIMRTDDNGNQLLQKKKKKCSPRTPNSWKSSANWCMLHFCMILYFSPSLLIFFSSEDCLNMYLFNWKFHQEGKFSVGPYRFNNTHPLKSIHVCDFRRSTNILKLKQTLFWTGKLFWIQYLRRVPCSSHRNPRT